MTQENNNLVAINASHCGFTGIGCGYFLQNLPPNCESLILDGNVKQDSNTGEFAKDLGNYFSQKPSMSTIRK